MSLVHFSLSMTQSLNEGDMMRITFKKHKKEAGLGTIGYPYQSVDIKIDKQIVGTINAPNWHKQGWRIAFAIEKPGNWRWIFPAGAYNSEEEARKAVKVMIPELLSKGYTFHLLGD